MGVNWSFWTYFGPAMPFMAMWVFWLIMNIRAHWANEMRGIQFNPVVAPGTRILGLMFVGGIIGATLTLTIPQPDILWHDPYDKPWVIPHMIHATLWMMLSVVSFTILLGKKHIQDEDENRCMFLVIFSLMVYMMQVLLEGFEPVQNGAEEGGGFDHRSWVVVEVMKQTRIITIPFMLTMLAEVFLSHKIFVFLRILFPGCLAAWFCFLAFMFGSEWCDDIDRPESHRCDSKSQAVQIHIARYMLPRIVVVGLFFQSLLWFRYIPPRLILALIPKDQVTHIPESRTRSHDVSHRRMGGPSSRSQRGRRSTGRNAANEMDHYGIGDDDTEVVDFDQDSRGANASDGDNLVVDV